MVEFDYTIKDELGIHVRPAGQLAQVVKELDSKVTMSCHDKSAEVTKIFAVMGLAVKNSDTVHIVVEGGNEEVSAEAVKKFLEENL